MSNRAPRRQPSPAADELRQRSNLSRAQFLMWLGQELDPDVPLYNMIQTFRIEGRVDPVAFDRAWQMLVERSDALRTTVAPRDGVPWRSVHGAMAVPTEIVDLRSAGDPERAARQWIDQRARRPIRMGERLWDTALLRLSEACAVWYLCQHHLITDGQSFAIAYRCVSECYGRVLDGRLDEAPLLPAYEDYVAYERQFQSSPSAAKAADYWRGKLTEPKRSTAFYGRTALGQTTRTDRVVLDVGPERSARLRQIAGTPAYRSLSEDLSLHTIWATLLFTTLHRVTGQSSLRVGTPFLGRPTPAFRTTIGLFIEVGALDAEVRGGDTFSSLAKRVQRELIQGALHARPGASSAELNRSYDVLLNSVTSRFEPFAGYPVTTEWVHTGSGDRDHALRLQISDFDGRGVFRLCFDVNLDVFGADERCWLLDQFQAVLDRFIEDPGRALGSFDLLTRHQRQHQVEDFNRTAADYPRSSTVVDLFEAQVRATPNAVAVQHGGQSVTYAQLDAHVNRVAHLLHRGGVGAETLVAICMGRSIHAVTAILAVLKTGGAYVPVDPSYPPGRRQLIFDDVQPTVVMTAGLQLTASELGWPVIDLTTAAVDEQPANPLPSCRRPDGLAYVIFTSGSTGRPKGTLLTHRGLVNYLWWAKRQYQRPGEALDFPLYSSLSFDLTITSLFVPLISGGRVVVYARSAQGDGLEIIDVFTDDHVDVVKLTPAHLSLVREYGITCDRIGCLIVGGENFRTQLARDVERSFRHGVTIFNEYGPTETVVGSMSHRYDPVTDTGPSVPIGRPIANTRIHVLDRYDQPVPSGVIGEIVISGDGVALGYRSQPKVTAERFGDDPTCPGARWYRTGDLARWGRDGGLEFLGRSDQQVKIRGARVELGEIEAALERHPSIDSAVVQVVALGDGAIETTRHCARCGLPSNYPGAEFDDAGECSDCRAYARYHEQVARYFRTGQDLKVALEEVRARARARRHDCLVLVSGGKDSTYMLYQLVRVYGVRPLVFTLDNGYISTEALGNVRSACADLDVELYTASTPHMNAIFADSLRRHANVCDGCFKTVYTLSMRLARERGIDTIMTGLSRGQLFETRLADTFAAREFDPDTIDQWVMEARQAYHLIDDAVYQLLDKDLFKSGAVLQDVHFIDFYRFVDVELDEVYRYLKEETVWRRPADTGRSTNCLINDVGIYVHKKTRGFHNYALPYSWDVRLGHKHREAAIQELDDEIDVGRVRRILGEIAYEEPLEDVASSARLAAYYVTAAALDPADVRAHLAASLPAYMVPSYVVPLRELPLTVNGKVDRAALPDPRQAASTRSARSAPPRTETERRMTAIWGEIFQRPDLGIRDNFFDLGGDSITSIRIVAESRRQAIAVTARDIFTHQTVAELSVAIDARAACRPATGLESAESRAPVDLPPDVRERVAALLARDGGWEAVEDVYPLTPTQQGMLYHSLRSADAETYFGQGTCTFACPVEGTRFREAWKIVCQRHPATRVRFVWAGLDTPLQVVRREVDFPWEEIDWRARSREDAQRSLDDLRRRQREAGLDLNGPALMSFAIVHIDGATEFVWNSHHALLDGWAAHVLFDEVLNEYEALCSGVARLAPAAHPFRDYVRWLAEQDEPSARQWWQAYLSGVDASTPLALPAPAPTDERGHDSLVRTLDAAVSGRLHEFARNQRVTLSTLANGAWGLLLSHYHGTDDVVFGSTVSGRDDGASGVDRMVGMLIATLPTRVRVDPDRTVGEWLQGAQRDALDARRHGHLGLTAIQRLTQVPTTETLFDSIVVVENYPTAQSTSSLRPSALEIGAPSNYALALLVHTRPPSPPSDAGHSGPIGGPLVLEAVYDRTRASAGAVDRLLGHLEQALVAMVGDARRRLGDVQVVPAGERPLLRAWSVGEMAPVPDQLIHEWIAGHSVAKPEAQAVIGTDGGLTYAELERRANQLAHGLQAIGVERGQCVGLVAGSSVLLVAGVQAILKAGAAYVPIDPETPAERVAHIVRETRLRVVLVDGRFDVPGGVPVVVIDLSSYAFEAHAAEPLTAGPAPDDLAYVIYTSGSTGTPKGVMVTHRNIAHSTAARFAFYAETVDSFLLLSPLAFDSSMVGLFWTLCSGGTLVMAPGDRRHDVGYLSRTIEKRAVTHLLALPSLYGLILDEAPSERLRSLRTVMVAGEACPTALVAAHRSRCPSAALVNEYGPTEGTVWSHAFRVTEGFDAVTVPIGVPIPNSCCQVLDRFGHPSAVGVPGELVIGGPGVTAGYLRRPDLTQRVFVMLSSGLDVASDGRYYRTGDLVRWRGDGTLEFLGRLDRQVKIRGHRVELDEVERVLVESPGVRAAVVLVTGVDEPDPQRRRLVACYCADDGFDEAAWRAEVATRLPRFMLPSQFVRLDQLPKTVTGKVDRRALAAVAAQSRANAMQRCEPGDDMERMVRDGWITVLGRADVGVDENFFELGGSSLDAMRLFAYLERTTGRSLRLSTLFEAPTVVGLANLLRIPDTVGPPGSDATSSTDVDPRSARARASSSPLVLIRKGEGRPPFFCVHGAGGNLLIFRELAARLGTAQPVYGLEARGVDGLSVPDATVEEMSALYLEAIRGVRAHGPYVLGGYSGGGVAALNVAQRLVALGEPVSRVVLLDTFHPSVQARKLGLRDHVSGLATQGLAYLPRRARARARRQLTTLQRGVRLRYYLSRGRRVPYDLREERLIRHFGAIARGYAPSPYHGEVTLFRARDIARVFAHMGPRLGWDVDLLPRLEVVEIPGDHDSMFNEPNLGVLATNLEDLLRRVSNPEAGS